MDTRERLRLGNAIGRVLWEEQHGIPFVPETRLLPPAPENWNVGSMEVPEWEPGDPGLVQMVSLAVFPVAKYPSDANGQTFPAWDRCWTMRNGDYFEVYGPERLALNPNFPNNDTRDALKYATDFGWLDLRDECWLAEKIMEATE